MIRMVRTKISEIREYAKKNDWIEDKHDYTFEKHKDTIFHASIGIDSMDDRWVVTGEIRKQYPRTENYEGSQNFEFSFQPDVETRSEAFGIVLDAMMFFDSMVNLFNQVDVWIGTSPAWISQSSQVNKK